MEFDFRGSLWTAALESYAQRRFGFALGRFADCVNEVHLELSPVPRSKDSQLTCSVRVGLEAGAVEACDASCDARMAIEGAAERAFRAVGRSMALRRAAAQGILVSGD